MGFTLKNYIDFPMGKGSSVVNLNEIKSQYRDELSRYENDNVFNRKIRMKSYRKGSRFLLIHFNFPSKTVDIEYDVVFEFDLKTFEAIPRTFDELEFKVFSNCPSFIYTFAFVFDAQDKLIPWLKGRYEKDVFRKKPTTRNPYQIQGIERSIYLCGSYLMTGGRNNVDHMLSLATKLDNQFFLVNNIKTQSQIMARYNYLKQRDKLEKKEKQIQEKKSNTSKPQPYINKTGHSVKHTASTQSIGMTKRSNKTKKTKKI